MSKKITAKPGAKATTKPAPLEKVPVVKKDITARHFMKRLQQYRSDAEMKKTERYFKLGEGQYGQGDTFIGVRMGQVFELAKAFIGMEPDEIEKLMDDPIHEARAGAMSIMDKQARDKKISPERRKALFDLYIRRIDRVNNWDLVDLGCLYMTGAYLFDKPRNILYKLAKSKNIWERRTAILSTTYFIRQGDIDDTLKIAAMLLKDKEDLVHKAAGWMLRFAMDKNKKRVMDFLDEHIAVMPRTMLRNAIEKLPAAERKKYVK